MASLERALLNLEKTFSGEAIWWRGHADANWECGTLQVSINIDYISEWLYQNRQLHCTRNGEVR